MRHRPIVVEIIGLAGAGKSTLAHALQQTIPNVNNQISLNRHLTLRSILQLTYFVIPLYLRKSPHITYFTQEEIRAMTYLVKWHTALQSNKDRLGDIQLLDLGPVYRLATLHEFGSPLTKDARFVMWHSDMLQQWQKNIDLVIWLDAPHDVLQQRINHRSKEHKLKGRPIAQSEQFFMRYHAAFSRVIEQMTVAGGLQVIQINSNRRSVEQIVQQVQQVLRTFA